MPCEYLLNLLKKIPDPRRAEGKRYALHHLLLFTILAILSGADSYRTVVTFIKVHRKSLNKTFNINWKRAPCYSSIGIILPQLNVADVEDAFREHAANLNQSTSESSLKVVAIDGKELRKSFDNFKESRAKQILSAFAADTALILAHIDIAEKSNEIPAVQKLLAEFDLSGKIVTLDAMHCQKKLSRRPPLPTFI
jgi:hypothetical protein